MNMSTDRSDIEKKNIRTGRQVSLNYISRNKENKGNENTENKYKQHYETE